MVKVECIPGDYEIYRRVAEGNYDKKRDRITPGAYMLRDKKSEEELSVEWAKYKTPEQAAIAPNGNKYYVAALYAREPRQENLQVNHRPSRTNIAHSVIAGSRLTTSQASNYEVAVILAEKSRSVVKAV